MANNIVITEIKTGDIKLRVPHCTERKDGTIWHKGEFPILITLDEPNAAELKSKYADAVKRKAFDEIDDKHFARLGKVCGTMVEWEHDRQERIRKEDAEKLLEPWIGVAKNGKVFIGIDARSADDVGPNIAYKGVKFPVSGTGKSYEAGDHIVVRIYIKVEEFELTNKAGYKTWIRIANDDQERHQYEFNQMMEDENNDGVNPPAPWCQSFWDIAEAIKDSGAPRGIKVYLSSRGWGDYSGVEWRGMTTVKPEDYLKEARELLDRAYDVDHPNQTDEELLKALEDAKK